MKNRLILVASVVAVIGLLFSSIGASAESSLVSQSTQPLTLAVFGDWPYSNFLLSQAPALVNSINSDSNVSLVIHVGDIHSGSMPCTGAGLDPIPVTANPGWNLGIYNIFQQFNDPLVYTPGDNEWTDCH